MPFTEVRREIPAAVRAGAGARVGRAEVAILVAVVVGGDVGLLLDDLRDGGGVARDVM